MYAFDAQQKLLKQWGERGRIQSPVRLVPYSLPTNHADYKLIKELIIKQCYKWETSERKTHKGEKKSDGEVIKGEITAELLMTDLEPVHTAVNQQH